MEAKAIDAFWRSRKNGTLEPSPEKIAQALLALFAVGALRNKAIVLRELRSGVGYVDLALIRSGVLHLLELKILRNSFRGAAQLQSYMETEQRREGWLVVFDARPPRGPTVTRATED